MIKPLLVISCPIDTWSGYGARSRDIVTALLDIDKFRIKILSQRWGATSFGFLQDSNPEHKRILDCILPTHQLSQPPDIWIQITVPNEFQPIGKYNIGITAGIETNLCDVSWIEGCNRMNLVLVSSNFAKKVFEESKYEKRDKLTNQPIELIELKTPVKVLMEGINTNIFRETNVIVNPELDDILNSIKESFCFLFVGHWLQGDLGQDRKDVGMLIKTFLLTFKGIKSKPALLLKTSGATTSIMDRHAILDKINDIKRSLGSDDLPNIYLLHGELEDEEMNDLYNHPKIKVMVSFTKGEGFGRPLAEFALVKKPVIVSGWGGHVDFIKNVLLPGELKQIHSSAVIPNMLLAESSWFTVDYDKAKDILKLVYENYSKFSEDARKQAYIIKKDFSLEKMKETLNQIFEENIPRVVELTLPKLQKIN